MVPWVGPWIMAMGVGACTWYGWMDGWMDEWADGIGTVSRQGRTGKGPGRGPSRRAAGEAHVPSQVVVIPGPGVAPTHPCTPALGYVPRQKRYSTQVPACPGTLPL